MRGVPPILFALLAGLAGACATFDIVGPGGGTSPTPSPSGSLTPTPTPTPVPGTPALVQHAHGVLATTATTLPVPFTAGTGARDLIVVAALTGAGITPTGVSDTQGNLYLVLGSAFIGGGASDRLTLFFAPNISGGGDTVTVTATPATSEIAATIAEFSSAGLAFVVSKNASNGPNIDCGTLIATNGQLVFAAEIDNASPTVQAGTGFQPVDSFYASGALADTLSDEYLAFSGPSTLLDPRFTINPGRPWACLGAAFQ